MANVRNANTYYIDTTGTITTKNIRLLGIIQTSTNTTSQLVLKDVTTGATKMDVRQRTADESIHFVFDPGPILFPNGIDVTTVTDCVATLIIEVGGG